MIRDAESIHALVQEVSSHDLCKTGRSCCLVLEILRGELYALPEGVGRFKQGDMAGKDLVVDMAQGLTWYYVETVVAEWYNCTKKSAGFEV